MKKKLFTLLTLLLCVCSGAWGTTDLINFPTSTSGITTGGTTTSGSVSVKGSNKTSYSFANSYYRNSGDVVTYNYIMLSTEGGFKTGDVVKLKACYKNSAAKTTALILCGATVADPASNDAYAEAAYDSGVLFTTQNCVNVNDGTTEPEEETYTLASDFEKLFIGRNGGTTTHLISLTVVRPGAVDPVFSLTKATIGVGETSQIQVGSKGNLDGITFNGDVTYDEDVVSVSSTGLVTGLSAGTTTIEFNTNAVADKYNARNSNSLTITVKNASDLALSSTSETIAKNGSAATVTYTTSSTGTVTVESSNTSVATVSVNTGTKTITITPVTDATGDATITVSQEADGTYLAGEKTISVTVKASVVWDEDNWGVPTVTLDLSDADAASTMLNKTWHSSYGRPLFGNDGENNYLTYSMVGVFNSTSTQTWAKAASAQTNSTSWSAQGVFKGYEKYMTSARASSVQSGEDHCYYAFRISGVNKAQVLAKSNSNTVTVTMAAFELTESTPAENTMLYGTCGNTESIISLNLDDTKDYVIILTNSGSTNSRLFEMALFYDKDVQLYEAITPAYEKSTYVTINAVDFTKADGITAYVATSQNGDDKVVMTPVDAPVPAKTPLMLVKKSGTTFNVPIATEAEAPTTNYLKAGPYDFTGEETDKYFLYTDGNFHLASAGTLAANKAYLDLEGVSASRVLSISYSDEETTGIEAVNVNTESNNAAREYYNLNGQRVANPTKGLYIVNGKKVIMK